MTAFLTKEEVVTAHYFMMKKMNDADQAGVKERNLLDYIDGHISGPTSPPFFYGRGTLRDVLFAYADSKTVLTADIIVCQVSTTCKPEREPNQY